jgi:hypothetical protein
VAALGQPRAVVRERVARIGTAIGRKIRFVELSEDQARARWRDAGVGEDLIDLLAAWQGNPPPHAYTVIPTVERILGRPPMSFDQWAAEHRATFL